MAIPLSLGSISASAPTHNITTIKFGQEIGIRSTSPQNKKLGGSSKTLDVVHEDGLQRLHLHLLLLLVVFPRRPSQPYTSKDAVSSKSKAEEGRGFRIWFVPAMIGAGGDAAGCTSASYGEGEDKTSAAARWKIGDRRAHGGGCVRRRRKGGVSRKRKELGWLAPLWMGQSNNGPRPTKLAVFAVVHWI